MTDYTGKPAAFIAVSRLGLVLDLACASEYADIGDDASVFWDEDLGLITDKETQPVDAILGMSSFTASGKYDTASLTQVTASTLQNLEATSSSQGDFSCDLNYSQAGIIACCSDQLFSNYVITNLGTFNYTGSVIYSKKIDNSTIIFSTTGIFIFNSNRNKLTASVLFPMNCACIKGDTFLIGTINGLFTSSLLGILQGDAPTLLLDSGTTPALVHSNISFISVDGQDTLLTYYDSADYFIGDLTTPITLSNISGKSHILNGKVATITGTSAEIGSLPTSSGAVTLEPITRFDWDVNETIMAGVPLNSRYSLSNLALYDDNVYRGNLPATITTGTDTLFGMIGEIVWRVSYNWEADGLYWDEYEDGINTTTCWIMSLETFRVTDTEILLLGSHNFLDYGLSVYLSYPYYSQMNMYDFLVFRCQGPVEQVGNSLNFYAYLRHSQERTIQSSNDYWYSLLAATGDLHKLGVDLTTGLITLTTKTITNTNSGWPKLRWRGWHHEYSTPFAMRINNELLYAGNEEAYHDNNGTPMEYVKGYTRLMTFSADTYDEGTASYPQPTIYSRTYESAYEVLDIRAITNNTFCTIEKDLEGNVFAILYGLNDNTRASMPHFKAIGEPVPIDRFISPYYGEKMGYVFDVNQHIYPYELNYIKIKSVTGEDYHEDCVSVLKVTANGLLFLGRFMLGADLIPGEFKLQANGDTYSELYTPFNATTDIVKGESLFVVDSDNIYAINENKYGIILAKDCAEVTVSQDANPYKGYITFSNSLGRVITKPIAAETGEWH